MHPLSNRAWGGVAVVAPKHLNCRFIKEFVAEGCGFVLGEILGGSVYLKSGGGPTMQPESRDARSFGRGAEGLPQMGPGG